MKFIIRRAIFAIITLPVALLAYAVIYFGIGLLTATNTASVSAFLENSWSVGFTWLLFVTFAKQIWDFAKRVSA
jgi:hypothetical protein